MKSGLLWYYKGDIVENIPVALDRYKERYNSLPNMIYMSDKDISIEKLEQLRAEMAQRGVSVETKSTVLPHHLFIGVCEPTNQ